MKLFDLALLSPALALPMTASGQEAPISAASDTMGVYAVWIAVVVAIVVIVGIIYIVRSRRQDAEPAPSAQPSRPEPQPAAPAAPRPAAPAERTAATPPSPAAPSADYDPEPVAEGSITILIAEDNPSNYKLLEVLLKRYRLVYARNGAEAVELFTKERPHLILMDINMPVMDGYEAVREIRKFSPRVPIIAITAYAFEMDRQKIMQSGFNAYISKPINASLLRETISGEWAKYLANR